MRAAIAGMYSYDYKSFEDLYGTRDNASDVEDEEDEDAVSDPFGRERVTRPYLAPTEQSETGYMGLDAPLG
jgi:hypothetical protein